LDDPIIILFGQRGRSKARCLKRDTCLKEFSQCQNQKLHVHVAIVVGDCWFGPWSAPPMATGQEESNSAIAVFAKGSAWSNYSNLMLMSENHGQWSSGHAIGQQLARFDGAGW
jgi:hypothetical protein